MSLATPERIRTLQRRLYVKAKKEPQYRFYTLYDKVYRWDILEHAYRLVRANAGAPGADGVTFEQIEAAGVEAFLREIQRALQVGTYRADPVRRVEIAKPDGRSTRPLGIPSIRTRVIQEAALLVLVPIFEADLPANAWGYRPKRSAVGAVKEVHEYLKRGYTDVVDADLRQYFETIPHAELMRCVARRISDRKMLALIKAWLQAPIVEHDDRERIRRRGGRHRHRGTPQGGVVSPLLALLYMRRFLLAWRRWEEQLQAYVCSYADDLVILCRGTAKEALAVMQDLMRRIKLEVNEEKTRIVNARNASFDFLGYTFGPRHYPQNGAWYLGAAPSKARTRRLRKKVHSILRRGNQDPIDEVIADLNRLLIGWSNYFCYGTVSKAYRVVDQYVADRLRWFLTRRHKRTNQGTQQFPDARLYQEYGLHRLQGTRVW
ncbi:MAG TPA: group II intron reverse transcriptase/maturase [bacterium]|nr:group II intron reverse transcriptase/maturase [bacterium]